MSFSSFWKAVGKTTSGTLRLSIITVSVADFWEQLNPNPFYSIQK
jgi:hypothetical protein